MMVRGAIPSLIQGISQQSPSLRPTGYIEDGLNAYPTIIEGFSRRPGADFIANFPGLTSPTAIHWIVRDSGERYLVAAQGGQLKVWDFAGTLQTIAAPNGWGYISGATSLGFLTVNDYTFVYDRAKVVSMSGTIEPIDAIAAHIWIRQGDYSTTYKVRVGYPVTTPTWYEATYTTSATVAADIKLDVIQQGVAAALVAILPAAFNVAGQDHVIFLAHDSGDDFLLEVHDDATDRNIVAVKDSVAGITELPSIASEGTHVRIRSTEANPKDDWWVKFTGTNPTGFSQGYWLECPEPGTLIEFDASTMPHVLVRETDGTFTFRQVEWGDRVSGGDTYSPRPSFVGKTIQEVSTAKGRVSFLGDGFFACSRADDVFNFWQLSVQQLLDSDPIDITPSYPRPYILKGSSEFQRGLILFSDNVQFIITAGEIFGPKTISSKPLSGFSLDVTKGLFGLQQDRVLCALKRQNFLGLQTFRAANQSGTDIVFDDSSAVVPSLIPGDVEWIDGSSTENVIVMKASGSNNLFIYKEATDGGKPVQSAWLPWWFKDRIPVSGKFAAAELFVLLKDSANKFSLERLSLQPLDHDQLTWDIYLDRRTEVLSGSFAISGDTTVVTLPWQPTASEDVYLVLTSGLQAGAVIKAVSKGTLTATFLGKFTGPGVVGVPARAFGTLSTLYYRKPLPGGGEDTVTEGALQLMRGKVSFSKSGPFKVLVKPADNAQTFTDWAGTPLIEDGGFTSPQDLQTGSTEFPIEAFNDRVTITFDSGDNPFPMRISGFEWKGDLNLQARPL